MKYETAIHQTKQVKKKERKEKLATKLTVNLNNFLLDSIRLIIKKNGLSMS